MELLVVGAGEMGRWFGSHFDDVAFADRERAAAERAADDHHLHGGARTVPLETAETFDAVCVAVPIPVVTEAIADHAERAERLLCDVSGVMAPAIDAMRAHAPDRERLSLHPLFAARNAPGRVAAVTDADGQATQAVYDALAAGGNQLFETTPAEHDEAMQTVQARAHAAVLAFGLARGEFDQRFHTDVSEALSELVDRVTDGSPRVYADIQAAFDGADDVATAAARVAETADDPDAFAELYREARDPTANRDVRDDRDGRGHR